MALGTLTGAIPREVQQRRRRVAPAEGLVVTHVDPSPPGRGLAVGQHGHGVSSPSTRSPANTWARGSAQRGTKKSRAAADLVGQRGEADRHALTGVALRLPVQRLMLAPGSLHPPHGPDQRVISTLGSHVESSGTNISRSRQRISTG